MAFPLSGCAMQQGDFPSLQKRPYESEPVIDEPETSVATLSSLPAAMRSKLDAAVAQSRSAHQQFLDRLPAVESRVDAARGAAVSSESWVVAHMELAAARARNYRRPVWRNGYHCRRARRRKGPGRPAAERDRSDDGPAALAQVFDRCLVGLGIFDIMGNPHAHAGNRLFRQVAHKLGG